MVTQRCTFTICEYIHLGLEWIEINMLMSAIISTTTLPNVQFRTQPCCDVIVSGDFRG